MLFVLLVTHAESRTRKEAVVVHLRKVAAVSCPSWLLPKHARTS